MVFQINQNQIDHPNIRIHQINNIHIGNKRRTNTRIIYQNDSERYNIRGIGLIQTNGEKGNTNRTRTKRSNCINVIFTRHRRDV